MSKPPPWEQPSPLELKKMVRNLILRHPGRHNQEEWVSNKFSRAILSQMPVDRVRKLLGRRKSIPDEQLSPDGLCGTRACVAGWAGILGSPPGTVIRQGTRPWDVSLLYPDGAIQDIETAAAKLLGMNNYQTDWLFDASRTRAEVLDGLKALIEDPDAELRDV